MESGWFQGRVDGTSKERLEGREQTHSRNGDSAGLAEPAE